MGPGQALRPRGGRPVRCLRRKKPVELPELVHLDPNASQEECMESFLRRKQTKSLLELCPSGVVRGAVFCRLRSPQAGTFVGSRGEVVLAGGETGSLSLQIS